PPDVFGQTLSAAELRSRAIPLVLALSLARGRGGLARPQPSGVAAPQRGAPRRHCALGSARSAVRRAQRRACSASPAVPRACGRTSVARGLWCTKARDRSTTCSASQVLRERNIARVDLVLLSVQHCQLCLHVGPYLADALGLSSGTGSDVGDLHCQAVDFTAKLAKEALQLCVLGSQLSDDIATLFSELLADEQDLCSHAFQASDLDVALDKLSGALIPHVLQYLCDNFAQGLSDDAALCQDVSAHPPIPRCPRVLLAFGHTRAGRRLQRVVHPTVDQALVALSLDDAVAAFSGLHHVTLALSLGHPQLV